MENLSHSNRVVMITGASSGVGRHLARTFAAAGARVVVAARRLDALNDLVEQIGADGGTAHAVALDVAEEDSVRQSFDNAEKTFGTIDTIISNAGIALAGTALHSPIEIFDRTIQINLRGSFLVASEGVRRIVESNAPRGSVVFVSSVGAHTVIPGLSSYCASKAGLVMLGKSLASEWARFRVNVNTVCPGYMRTEMNGEWFDSEGGARQVESFPNGRLMPMEALDPALLFLTSDLGCYTTGSVITVDDAQSLLTI